MKGANFIKYCRIGKEKTRKIYLSSDEKKIYWQSIDANDNPRFINVSDVKDLCLGCNTTDVFKKNNVPVEFDQLCFSIITN